MAFTSNVITIEWHRNNLILKRGDSRLLIEADKVQDLRAKESQNDFSEYFLGNALVNREARRVFKSWERKDKDLISKLFSEVKQ